MVKRPKSSRTGVSTAIGAVFFMILIVASLTAIQVIDAYQTRYQQIRDSMAEWDINRMSENLNITSLRQPSEDTDYTFDLIISNEGGVFTKVIRVYVYDSTIEDLFRLYDKQSSLIDEGFAGGEIIQGEKNYRLKINSTDALQSSPLYRYRIIVCTERGRQFSYNYPSPFQVGFGGGYPLIIGDRDNFQYTAGIMTNFEEAYVKARGTDRTLYRLAINNTTDKRIYFHQNCTMLHMQGAVGAITERFIVSNRSWSWNDTLYSFSSHSVAPGDRTYLCYASTLIGGNEWQSEPIQKDYYVIGFIIWFNYEGDPEIRNVSLPTIVQELTD